jgi:hypothetical protein
MIENEFRHHRFGSHMYLFCGLGAAYKRNLRALALVIVEL